MPRYPSRSVQLRVSLLAIMGFLLMVLGWLVRPKHESVLRAAEAAYHGGDFEQAAHLYSQALDGCEDVGHVVFNRAAALYELKRDAEAAEDFGAVRHHSTGDRAAKACYNRGNCLLRRACGSSAEERLTLLRAAIHEYETCLRQNGGRSASLESDARHNLALAKQLLEQHLSEQTRTGDNRRPDQASEQLASADRKDADNQSLQGEDNTADQKPSESDSGRETNKTQTCPVCGAECKKCDKECSSCKSCLGKHGNSASPSGSGAQPTPGEGNGAGKQGGQQPQPSQVPGNQGRTGRSSGAEGAKPASQASEQPGGVPGPSNGRPRPGSQPTRNQTSDVGARIGEASGRSSLLSSSGNQVHTEAPGQSQDTSHNNLTGSTVSSGPSGIGTIAAEPAARELVEVFFQPDLRTDRELQTSRNDAGQASPKNPQVKPTSAASRQAERALRSAVQRIEQSRNQRLKLHDIWRDRPDQSRDYKDW